MASVILARPRQKPCQNSAHLLASPVVYSTAPSARSLAVPCNRSYNDSLPNVRSQEPILIDFLSGWQTGSVHEWYTRQPTTRFLLLEYRKDLTGTFRHEFIVVRLDNGACCRFDRRAKQDLRVHAVKDKGTVAEDTAHVLHPSQPEFTAIEDGSELILSMSFPEGRDMLLILAIFFSIKSNAKSRRYTLTRYNCYFVCWTITLIVARCVTDWSPLSRRWDTIIQFTLRATASHHRLHRPAPPATHLDLLRHDTYNTGCWNHRGSNVKCGFKCTTFSKALHSELSSVGDVIEATIHKYLLQSKIKAITCKLIKAALANAIIELAGRHALYIRRRIRINRRIYLDRHGHLFFTRVYEPGSSEATTSALKKAAVAAASAHKNGLNGKNWNREWNAKWEEGWPTEGRLMRWAPARIWASPEADRWCERDHDSSAFLRSRHKIGWMKEFKQTMQLGESYLPVLIEAATSRFLELLVDLDPARFKVGGKEPILKDIDGKLKTISMGAYSPLAFQSIISQRIEVHCLMVQSLGFGLLADVRSDIEDVMTEVWVQTQKTLEI
ncbi:hypothetical protein FRC12_024972 [Ceratobasidium sp. 428]|nr:hypothetical protein FRC12_024972 [Ceratobasidium sp. 428]